MRTLVFQAVHIKISALVHIYIIIFRLAHMFRIHFISTAYSDIFCAHGFRLILHKRYLIVYYYAVKPHFGDLSKYAALIS